jgi:hypothetical protein
MMSFSEYGDESSGSLTADNFTGGWSIISFSSKTLHQLFHFISMFISLLNG